MNIDWQVIGVRRWIGIAIGVVVCGVVWVVVSGRGGRTPLPKDVAEQVERHKEATAIDTMEIHRLERVADSAEVKEQAAVVKARASEAGLKRAAARRDSMAPAPAAPAATALRVPPEVSVEKLSVLTIASAQKDTALMWAEVEATALDSALTRSEARAAGADTVIGAVATLVEAREEPCRVFWVLRCPTRIAVMLGTAVGLLLAVERR